LPVARQLGTREPRSLGSTSGDGDGSMVRTMVDPLRNPSTRSSTALKKAFTRSRSAMMFLAS
jgi:hypothetical protein